MLVNDIWGAELLKGGPAQWNTPIWEHDLDDGLRILRLAIDTHLITSHHLLPLLIDRPGGLLVEVTDGTTDYNASRYRISVFYDLAKVAVNRLAFSQGHELAPHGATAVAITPGWLRSEMMLENFGVSEANWRDAIRPGSARAAPADFALSESPRYVGRAVAAAGRRSRSRALEPAVGHLRRSSRASTGSPTSTARGPTSGATSRRSASAGSRPTSTTTGKHSKEGRRPRRKRVVGVRGFEPPTPCSQSRCATGLRHTPTF